MLSRSRTISLNILLLTVLSSGSVMAAEKHGWYVGAGVGYAKNTISDAYFPAGNSEKTNATGFKLYGGYQFNSNWATELEYVYLGKYRSDSANKHSIATASGLGISAVGMLPLSEQWTLLGKVGGLAKMVKADEYNNSRSYNYAQTSTKFVPLVGFGAEYRLTPAMSIRAEYEYFGRSGVGENDAKLANQLLSISASYHF